MSAKSVTCAVTGVVHAIVSHDQNAKEFIDWCTGLKARMDGGHFPIISLDTEGVDLGVMEHSLGSVQLAEVFNEGFLQLSGVSRKVPVDMKPGFIILFPCRADVLAALSSVLSHNNIFIIMFDCTSDLCAMTEAGVSVNRDHIFDSQLVSCNERPYLDSHQCYALRKTIPKVRSAAEYCQAMQALEAKGSVNFDLMTYQFHGTSNPFEMVINSNLMQYSGNDIALNAIAAIGVVAKVKLPMSSRRQPRRSQRWKIS